MCVEKWARGHRCSQTVQLHAVQELWELLQVDVDLDSISDLGDTDSQLILLLSQEAVTSGSNSRTLKFLGNIQGQEVVILIDSGSSNSFVNAKLAPMLLGISQLSNPVKVQVANGQVL